MGPTRISGKLYASFFLVMAGFVISGAFLFTSLSKLKVNGPMYAQLVAGRDLVADVLPPPNYIIEAYLVAYELRDAMDDPVRLSELEYAAKRLESEFTDRQAFWERDESFLPGNEILRTTFLERSREPALGFFRALDGEYIPAIRSKDRVLADSILAERLRPLYEEHRKQVDIVVGLTRERNKQVESDAKRLENANLLACLAACSLSVALAFALVFLLRRSVMKPIDAMTAMLREVGEGNLTGRIELATRDEISEMASYLNETVDGLKGLISAIRLQSQAISAVGEELSARMEETSLAAGRIGEGVSSVRDQTLRQASSVTETNAAMEQISRTISSLNSQIQRQSAAVAQSSSAIEQMLANIASVTKSLNLNGEDAAELAALSDTGKGDLAGVSRSIGAIAKDTESLLEISGIIQDIASRTNLLSMNAAIEAAHAGDSGRGFAVVADEIRKLAESSGAQAKTVSAVLRKTNESMALVKGSSEGLLDKFGEIDARIRLLSERERSILDSMREQSAGSGEILSAIGELNDISARVSSGAAEMLSGSAEVIGESRNLGTISQSIGTSVRDMDERAGDIAGVVSAVSELSVRNRESVASLLREISKFRVDGETRNM